MASPNPDFKMYNYFLFSINFTVTSAVVGDEGNILVDIEFSHTIRAL